MSGRSFNWLPIILVLTLAAMTFWLEQSVQQNEEKARVATSGVDFWADNFTVRSFGVDGKFKSMLSAMRLTHESADDSSILREPRIVTGGATSLVVIAERGLVNGGAEVVELIGNVKLDQAGTTGKGARKGPLQVRTERMLVHPDREFAEGRTAVRIQQRGIIISAGSFRIDGRSGVSIFEKHVRATLPPRNP